MNQRLTEVIKKSDRPTTGCSRRCSAVLRNAAEPERSYNRVSHDALLHYKGCLGQKPRAVTAVVGFDYYLVRCIEIKGKEARFTCRLKATALSRTFCRVAFNLIAFLFSCLDALLVQVISRFA